MPYSFSLSRHEMNAVVVIFLFVGFSKLFLMISATLNSPVIVNSKQFISADGHCIKSTPAGKQYLKFSKSNMFKGTQQ